MIPMRDGVKLHTTIFVPRGVHAPLPFIFTRTPYGAAGVARRYVPGRRLPSQWRLPAELRLRVCRDDGDVEGARRLRLRSLRHLPVVSRSRAALQRQCTVPPRQDPHLERLRRTPELRLVLAEAGRRAVSDARHRPD